MKLPISHANIRQIDLHWSLIRWEDHSSGFWKRIWDDRITIQIDQTEIATLSPTHTALALIMHAGCHHMCTDWASLHDIACCINKWERIVDWQHIVDLATSMGLTDALYPPLLLASEHFGATVPKHVLSSLKLPVHQRGLNIIARAGFNGQLKSRGRYEAAKRLWNLLSQAGLYQKCHLVAKWVKHQISCGFRQNLGILL